MIYTTPLLETERLILKRGTGTDFKKVYEYDFTKLRNIAGEFELVKQDPSMIEGFEEPYDNSYDWIVYLKETMEPIGNIIADREQKEIHAIELAFNTHPNYWNYGYTYEALLKVLEFLFNQGYSNVLSGYDEGNFKSKALAEKLGFVLYETKEAAWLKNKIPITTYVTILSKSKYNELYQSSEKQKTVLV